MKKYNSLLNQKVLKQNFIIDLLCAFSSLDRIEVNNKWELVNSSSFNHWDRIRKYPDGHISKDTERYKDFKMKFSKLHSTLKWELLGIQEIEFYLIHKVNHMIFNKGDFNSVYQMLSSFEKGTKKLRSNVTGTDGYYEWVERGGTEYPKHSKNLERAHFRWNYGERYKLNSESLSKISKFLKEYVL